MKINKIIGLCILMLVCVVGVNASELLVTTIGVTDIHHSLYGSSGVDGATRIQAVQQAAIINNADFIFNNGDNIYENSVQANHILQMQSFEKMWINTTYDHWSILGNHDYKNSVTPEMTKQEVLNIWNTSFEGNDYYYKDYNNTRFVFLSASYNATSDFGFDDRNSPYGAYVPQHELNWLNETLYNASSLGYYSVIVFHYRLDDTTYGSKNNTEVNNILYNYNETVIAVMQGHQHENRYSLINGIHYITFYSPVLHTYNYNNYEIIRIYETNISIDGIGSVIDRELTINSLAQSNLKKQLKTNINININVSHNRSAITNIKINRNNGTYYNVVASILNWSNIIWSSVE